MDYYNSKGWKIVPPRVVTDLEIENRLSEAYSSLKECYCKLKQQSSIQERENKALREELKGYEERYSHLVKYLNSLVSETGEDSF